MPSIEVLHFSKRPVSLKKKSLLPKRKRERILEHFLFLSLCLLSYCFIAAQLQGTPTLKVSRPSQPLVWSLGCLAALWVMCLRWGLWPKALQNTDINSTDGFICFGTPYVCTCVSLPCVSACECACMCTSTLPWPVLPSIFHRAAYNTHHLSPSNIYLMPIVHLRCAYITCICMRPEIISVMASRST